MLSVASRRVLFLLCYVALCCVRVCAPSKLLFGQQPLPRPRPVFVRTHTHAHTHTKQQIQWQIQIVRTFVAFIRTCDLRLNRLSGGLARCHSDWAKPLFVGELLLAAWRYTARRIIKFSYSASRISFVANFNFDFRTAEMRAKVEVTHGSNFFELSIFLLLWLKHKRSNLLLYACSK